MKTCTKCGLPKPYTDFNKRSALTDGHSSNCKTCTSNMSTSFNRTPEGVVTSAYSHQIMNSKKRGHPMPAYTKEALLDWCITQPLWLPLLHDWSSSKFSRRLKPSVDRISNFKPYTLDNIQLMTTQDNIEKNAADIKSGTDTRICKPIRQLSKKGVEINTYYSIQEASRCNKGKLGFTTANIIHALNKDQTTAGGYQWEYI